jgi:hypothetical protein
MSEKYAVRSATARDAAALAEVHGESYRSTYAGIFAQSVFDGRLSSRASTSGPGCLLSKQLRP